MCREAQTAATLQKHTNTHKTVVATKTSKTADQIYATGLCGQHKPVKPCAVSQPPATQRAEYITAVTSQPEREMK